MLLLTVLLASTPIADWQYRWGTQAEWADLRLPAHPPRGEGVLWQRARLPQVALREPALKLDGVIGHFELQADGAPIYVHPAGGLDAKGVAGVPWHLISLPPGTGEVTLRVRTSYRLAGVQAVPELGERSALLEAMVRADTPRFVIGALMVLLGGLGLLLFPRPLGVGFGLYAVSAGLYSAYYSQVKQLVLPLTPGIWFFVWLISLAVAPVGFLRFFAAVLHSPPRSMPLLVRTQQTVGIVFVVAMAVAGVSMTLWGQGAETWASPLLFGLGAVVRLTMIVTGGICLAQVIALSRRPGPDRANARALGGGFVLVAAASLLNVGAALGLVSSTRGAYVPEGLLVLAIVLAVIAQRAWAQTQSQLAVRVKEKEAMLRDLHDGIGGLTTNIRLLADVGKRDSQKAMKALATISELSAEGLAELRAFSQTLAEGDAQVSWLMFIAELRRFGGQLIESHGKGFSLKSTVESTGRPASAMCLSVLRIFREALTNVVKYAAATRVDVNIAVTDRLMSLSIADDGGGGGRGGGLDTGRGLQNMQARARELGGELSVVTGAGTRLSLDVPLPEP